MSHLARINYARTSKVTNIREWAYSDSWCVVSKNDDSTSSDNCCARLEFKQLSKIPVSGANLVGLGTWLKDVGEELIRSEAESAKLEQ